MAKTGMEFKLDFTEMWRLQAALNRLGNLPQKVVNRAAGKGATVAGRAIRAAAPVGKTGQLRRGFVRKPERSKTKGKKVYDYSMDPAKNDIFQKPIKNPGALGGKKYDHAYYPSSVEYGFLARAKGGGVYHVPGQHFVRKAAESSSAAVQRVIIDTMMTEIEKEWRKK